MPKASTNRQPQSTETEDHPLIHLLKSGECASLTGKSTLSFQIGHDTESALFIRIIDNTGGGHFGKDWVAIEDLLIQLQQSPEHITSATLSSLFHRKSSNTAGFVLAVLLDEGVIKLTEGKQRAYTLQDTEPFLTSMGQLRSDAEQGKSKPTPRRKRQPPSGKKSSTSPVVPVASDET